MTRLSIHFATLSLVDSFDFDVFAIVDELGRKHAFEACVFRMFQSLSDTIAPTVELNWDKLISFLKAIRIGYRESVPYHNDLHGADVAQMLYLIITKGGLEGMAQLSY